MENYDGQNIDGLVLSFRALCANIDQAERLYAQMVMNSPDDARLLPLRAGIDANLRMKAEIERRLAEVSQPAGRVC